MLTNNLDKLVLIKCRKHNATFATKMAEGTIKEALKKLDDQLECSVCFEPFKQPKILPCFHVFCSPCLEKVVTKDGKLLEVSNLSKHCPIDKKGSSWSAIRSKN